MKSAPLLLKFLYFFTRSKPHPVVVHDQSIPLNTVQMKICMDFNRLDDGNLVHALAHTMASFKSGKNSQYELLSFITAIDLNMK